MLRPTKRDSLTKPARSEYADVTPKANPSINTPHEEDFAAWCLHPVTQWVALAHKLRAEDLREQWINYSWEYGKADPEKLLELKVEAVVNLQFLETKKEDYEQRIKDSELGKN